MVNSQKTGCLAMKVNLNVILDAIEMADDNYTYFLDLETGESVFLVDELVTGLDNKGLDHEIEEKLGTLFKASDKI